MKQFIVTLAILCSSFAIFAQTTIKLDEVSKHINDSVIVCGTVADVRYFENSDRQPTFLNIGAKYPNQAITIVIWGETRKLFSGKIEDLLNKTICITGRIIVFKERPEIVIENVEQIQIQ
jgi:DNA/RNA endonuclease YhcR with UshA esterase domain